LRVDGSSYVKSWLKDEVLHPLQIYPAHERVVGCHVPQPIVTAEAVKILAEAGGLH
jgi:hypothetical protein